MAVTLTCGNSPQSKLAFDCFHVMERLEARWLASAATHIEAGAYFGSTLTATRSANARAVTHPLRRRHRAPAPPPPIRVGPIQSGPIHAGPVHPIPAPPPPPVNPAPPPTNPPPPGPGTPPGGIVGTTRGALGDGIPDYIYNPTTGDLRFTSDGLPHTVGQLEAYSASGLFLTSSPKLFVDFSPTGIIDADLG